jgi:hypothetical protein
MSSEAQIHEAVCNYIKLQYPKVMFNSDMSGVKLTKLQAVRAAKLRSSKGFPDLVIYESRGKFKALFIELKKDRDELFCKDGLFRKTEHIANQRIMLNRLSELGYEAVFACGFDEVKDIIDEYLKLC